MFLFIVLYVRLLLLLLLQTLLRLVEAAAAAAVVLGNLNSCQVFGGIVEICQACPQGWVRGLKGLFGHCSFMA